MAEPKLLTEQFEAARGHLRAVAFRMLGSRSEAEDAVQEAWLRLARADAGGIDNLRAWLTTVVARVCLDMLRARKSRREEPIAPEAESVAGGDDPERDAATADSIGVAMLVVLEALRPAERVAFVLHDMFNLPFEEIAPIVARSPAAARQLASRARRRVQGASADVAADAERKRAIVSAFLAASREGDFSALLAVLDPAVVLRADAAAVTASLARAGAPTLQPEMRGRDVVAETFKGRARAAQAALVDGEPGLVVALGGQLRVVFEFVVENGRIAEIGIVADPNSIAARDVAL